MSISLIEQPAEPAAPALSEAAAVASAIEATVASTEAEHAAEAAADAAETVAASVDAVASEAANAAFAAETAVAIDSQVLDRIAKLEQRHEELHMKHDRIIALLEELLAETEEPDGEGEVEIREVPPEPPGDTEPQDRHAGRRYAKGF